MVHQSKIFIYLCCMCVCMHVCAYEVKAKGGGNKNVELEETGIRKAKYNVLILCGTEI